MTDAERIETALRELKRCIVVFRDYDRDFDMDRARSILEQLVAERAVVPGGSALVEAKREVQSLRRDLAAAQQRLAEVEAERDAERARVPLIREELRGLRADVHAYIDKCDALRRERDALRGALEGVVKMCRCRGTGKYTRHCTLCGDSTYDHECNDTEKPCVEPACMAARAALARGEGEGQGQ